MHVKIKQYFAIPFKFQLETSALHFKIYKTIATKKYQKVSVVSLQK